MATLDEFLGDVLARALKDLERKRFALYTLAFYLDHESAAVSVCADTHAKSKRVVKRINSYNIRHFLDAVRHDDLKRALLWQANIGRSLSLGDFAAVNLARTDLGDLPADDALCTAMVRTLVKNHSRIRHLAPRPSDTILACSTLNDEVGLVWSLPGAGRLKSAST